MFVWVRIHACVKACHDQEMNKKKIGIKLQSAGLLTGVSRVYSIWTLVCANGGVYACGINHYQGRKKGNPDGLKGNAWFWRENAWFGCSRAFQLMNSQLLLSCLRRCVHISPWQRYAFYNRQRQLIMIDGGRCNNEPLSFQGKFGGKFEVKPANLLLLLQT